MLEKKNYPIKAVSRLPLDGAIETYFEVESLEEHCRLLQRLDKEGIPYVNIGAASNILFASSFIETVVVRARYHLCFTGAEQFVVSGSCSAALAGERFAAAGAGNLIGAETIPGTIGAGIKGHASFRERDFFDGLQAVWLYERGKMRWLQAEAIDRKYRKTDIAGLVLLAFYKPSPLCSNYKDLRRGLNNYRKEHQLSVRGTLGSTYRNPPGLKAYELLAPYCQEMYSDKFGFSAKHHNFLEVKEGAKPEKILEYLSWVEADILKRTGIRLEREIKLVY